MSNSGTGHMARWATRPLCVKYLVVSFGVQSAALSAGSEFRNLSFSWALGTLEDGEAEILGWWLHREPNSISWSTIGADLTARGVKSIRVLVDPAGALSNSGGLDCPGGGASDARSMSATQHRRVAESTTRLRRIQGSLSRAFLRHGAFADADSAAALVDSELQRLDRLLWSSPAFAGRESSQSRSPLTAARAVAA